MPTYQMTLTADFSNPQPLTPRSSKLGFCFDAPPSDEPAGGWEVMPGDEVEVFVHIVPEDGQSIDNYSVRSFNLISWRSHRLPNQLFDGMLRDNQDQPDRKILSTGEAEFERLAVAPALSDTARTFANTPCNTPSVSFAVWQMKRPTRVVLSRPGLFTFLVEVAIETPDGTLKNFIIDPELDVGGTYPPD